MIHVTGGRQVGRKVWRIPGAIASALATFGPPRAIYFGVYWMWRRFHASAWQPIVRGALVPVTIGLVIARGTVMARTARADWWTPGVTVVAAVLMPHR
jgi:chromate transporter